MTSGSTPRSLTQGILLKVGLPILIGILTLVAANIGGIQVRSCLELAAVVAFAVALVLFIVDTEIRISAVGDGVTTSFTQISRLAELSGKMERSSLGRAPLEAFLETASQVDEQVNPLLQRLARRELDRVALFLRQLPTGPEISYEGEDRD